MSNVRRIQLALLAVLAVVAAGSIGYIVLGFGPLDAVYQTVTTITTVGFRELHPLSTAGKIFTIVLILAGVGTALYAFSVVLESLVEGHLRQHFERRRMERDIARMSGHTIVCGWGRVGRAVGGYLAGQGAEVVVVDLDPQRVARRPLSRAHRRCHRRRGAAQGGHHARQGPGRRDQHRRGERLRDVVRPGAAP